MLYKDFEGRTEQDALKRALKELQLSEDQVRFEVISSTRSGFLGIGGKKVQIRVFYKEVDPLDMEGSELDSILSHIISMISMIDTTSTSSVKKLEEERYLVQVESPDPARLIGKHGRIVEALQDVINGILQRHSNRFKIVVDIVGYNQSQKVRIVSRAKKIAVEILKRGGTFKLDPMNPFYRRLVHLELQKMENIVTQSEGEGKLKSIIISRKEGALGRPYKNQNSFSNDKYLNGSRGQKKNNNSSS